MRSGAALLGLLLAGAALAQEAGDAVPKAELQLLSDAVRIIKRNFARITDDAVLASGCADALATATGTSERAARSLDALPPLLKRAYAATGGRLSYPGLARSCIEGMVAMLDQHSQLLDAEAVRALYRSAREPRADSVRAAWAEGDVLELRVARFTEQTRNDLQREIGKLAGIDRREPRGILLDLRGNAGGLFYPAVDASGLFLADGVAIGSTHGPAGRLIASYRAGGRTPPLVGGQLGPPVGATSLPGLPERVASALRNAPLAVLVDRRTASSAEILAAALQASGRGTLVGEPTAGMGSIQTLYPLSYSASGALKLTTAYWFGPKEIELDGNPLVPDLAASEAGANGVALRRLAEARRGR